ncbi:MAG: Ig-like domain repeat protein, partial [Rhodanobacteraceae bacterium]
MTIGSNAPGRDGFRTRARDNAGVAGAARSWLLVLLALVGAHAAVAEEPPPLSLPHIDLLTSGAVRAMVRLGDGSLVIGGYFDSINGVPRSNIAKVRPDGTVDPDWNPSADESVASLAVGADGSVYAGGLFSTIGGRARSRLAKIAPGGAGVVDAVWAPAANAEVAALVADSHGSVYVGGSFSSIGGTPRSGLAKLSSTGNGALDASWNPAPSGGVDALALDASDALYVGGSFLAIGGQSRRYAAKLSSVGVVDALWNPSPDGEVSTILLDGNRVYIGGAFFVVGGATRNFVAKLSASGAGAVDAAWNATSNGNVYALAKGADGAIYAGGMFSVIGGLARNRLARLSPGTGSADTEWDASGDDNVLALCANADGTLFVGGEFANLGARQHLAFALVDAFGETNTANVDAEIPGHAGKTVEQADGSLIVGGTFWKAGQAVRAHLLKITPNGTLDPDWKPLANGFVYTLAQDAGGSIYAAGVFTTINGVSRNRLARLSGAGTGTLDAVWNPGADGPAMSLAVLPGSALFVGGSFAHIGGVARTGIAKVSTSGTGAVDATWSPSMDSVGSISAMALDGSGGLYVGGHFTFIGGATRKSIAKLATTGAGAADATWNPSPNADVTSLILDGAGNVYTGGTFTTIGGLARNYVAKLSASGTGAAAASWSASPDSFVYTLALDTHGGLFAGGVFGRVGATPRLHLARLSTIDGALDAAWNATAVGDYVSSLASVGDDALAVGGDFSAIGGVPRTGFAVLRSAPRAATTVVLSAGGISTVTEPVAFTATLDSVIDVEGGTVRIGDAESSCTANVVHATASCAVAFAHAGQHLVTATYSGDEEHQPAVSAAVTQTVTPAATALAIASQNPNPSIPGQPVTVSVNLQLIGGAPGPATGAISIDADDGGACTITLPATSCALAFTARGVQQVAAHYAGNADFSSSSAFSHQSVNFRPIATDDEMTSNEDQPFTVNATDGVLANDEDPDGGDLVVGDPGPR